MLALRIVLGVIGFLATAGIGVLALISMIKKIDWLAHLIFMCGAGALALSCVFAIFDHPALLIPALVFGLIGWGGVATGWVLLTLKLWKAAKAEEQAATG